MNALGAAAPLVIERLDLAAVRRRAREVSTSGWLTLVNSRSDRVIAETVELAVTRETRRKGLLGRTHLPVSSALVLAPCFSIHTAFMRFPIDVAFVDRQGRVLKTAHDTGAWRMALRLGASAVVELSAGVLRAKDVSVGDRLLFLWNAGQ